MPLPAKKVYQPIWVNGEVDAKYRYQRDCEGRYEPIRELASKFNRKFSVLDIGANYGYFDFRLMEDFDCTCVMVDNKLIDGLIRWNEVEDRAIWINRHIDAQTLKSLSICEHFDIVLGLAVLHHFDDPALAFDALCNLGRYTFFEIPGEDDVGAAHPDRHRRIRELFKDEEPIAHFPSHVSNTKRPWYLIESEPVLLEQRLDAADADAPQYATYTIDDDFDESTITINRGPNQIEHREYYPGMNLYNFQRLGGGHPQSADIARVLRGHSNHRDFQAWNFILGHGIYPIDE